MNKKTPTFSFEFFPPKTEKGIEKLKKTAQGLAALDPKFMTVTYGAGGSTQEKTFDLVTAIQQDTSIPTATHLTYINKTREEMYALADELWDRGIKHIVALRGDMPKDLKWPLDPDPDYFQYTSHFVTALKARHNFEISVGAYPEKHPDAGCIDTDVKALHEKMMTGADRAITQFFFNNGNYYDFLERTAKAGIKQPIVPGILPIYDYQKMLGFATTCQANVPNHIRERYENADEADHGKISEEILIAQIRDLIENGVEHFHIYTLNKSNLIQTLHNAL